MNEWLDYVRELNMASICLRVLLAVICGGTIGLERGVKGRAAGFRTHILVCVGAAMATMTGQYIVTYLSPNADPARIGAQVVSGIGFLGVGTIVTTKAHRVRGLTTAAGLWTSACIGLTVGIGFYEAAIVGMIAVTVAVIALQKVDRFFYGNRNVREYYIEVDEIKKVRRVLTQIKKYDYKILETIIEQDRSERGGVVVVIVTVKSPARNTAEEFMLHVGEEKSVLFVEEI